MASCCQILVARRSLAASHPKNPEPGKEGHVCARARNSARGNCMHMGMHAENAGGGERRVTVRMLRCATFARKSDISHPDTLQAARNPDTLAHSLGHFGT
eukprot:COSAG02_NODE_8590_length_2512_cov_1.718193_2_plen_100_part_00